MMAKRRKGRPGAAKNKLQEDEQIKNGSTEIRNLRQKNHAKLSQAQLFSLCCLAFIIHLVLVSITDLDLQSMISLQWDAALEQWASRVSPKLASPHLPMAFFLFQDAAFVCALAWSVSITQLCPLSMGEIFTLL